MADEIGTITASTSIQMRDSIGRFQAILDRAAEASARDLTDKAVELAKRNAERFKKSGELEASIGPVYQGKKGKVEATAPHAHSIEAGAIAHSIPNAFGRGQAVMHPGNQAQPYLEPVPKQLQPYADGILQRNYP
jgi:precorrin-6B methylase 2